MTLAQFLTRAGYRQIPLTAAGGGRFQAAGTLNGRPVAVWLDTMPDSITCVSLDLVRDLGLAVARAEAAGGAVGTHLDLFRVPEATLLVAGVALSWPILARDLRAANQAAARLGKPLFEAFLGFDLLAAQAAVIDYGGSSLFLRE
jgi:hypothetical protein